MDLHLFDLGGTVLRETMHSLASIIWILIPLAGIAWLLAAGLSEEKTKRLRMEQLHRERMLALEKGMTDVLERVVEASETVDAGHRNPIGLLTGGIITMGAGVGLSIFMWIAVDGSDRTKAIAIGAIPLFIGAALIVAWRALRRYGDGVPRNG